MTTGWKLFRIACSMQLALSMYEFCTALGTLLHTGRFYFVIESICYLLAALFALFAINLLTANYPDKPVTGTQKSIFNWLFLLNFLLLSFLFAVCIFEYRQLQLRSVFYDIPITSLDVKHLVSFIIAPAILLFQFLVLYGLYALRKELYANFNKNREFEFEKKG